MIQSSLPPQTTSFLALQPIRSTSTTSLLLITILLCFCLHAASIPYLVAILNLSRLHRAPRLHLDGEGLNLLSFRLWPLLLFQRAIAPTESMPTYSFHLPRQSASRTSHNSNLP